MSGHVAVSPACPAGYQIGVSVSLHWKGSEGRTAVERQRAAVEGNVGLPAIVLAVLAIKRYDFRLKHE